jgi:hypothetical protein
MRLPCEGSPDPAADGGVPELARVPRQGSAIGQWTGDLFAPTSPLLSAQNEAKPHKRCPEHQGRDVIDHRLRLLPPRASVKRLGS